MVVVRRWMVTVFWKSLVVGLKSDVAEPKIFIVVRNLAQRDVQGLPATRVRVAGSVRPFRRVREIVHEAFCPNASCGSSECALALIQSQVSIHVFDELYLIG